MGKGLACALQQVGPRLTSLDLNVQSNMLLLLDPAVGCLGALTRLRYSLSDHYAVTVEDCTVMAKLTGDRPEGRRRLRGAGGGRRAGGGWSEWRGSAGQQGGGERAVGRGLFLF